MSSIILPFPPTTNNLFMNAGKRRIRTKRYDAWIAEASVMLKQQTFQKIAGEYIMDIRVRRPDRRKRDLSNLIKAVEDFLVSFEVVEDDSLAQRITVSWALLAPLKGGFVSVEVAPWGVQGIAA